MEAMIRIRQERKMTDNKETAFLLRGRPVNDAKIDRYEKEHGDMDVDMGEIPMPTPSDISFTTPKNAVSPTPQDAPSPQSISKPKAGAIPESTIPSSATSGGYQESHGYGYSQVGFLVSRAETQLTALASSTSTAIWLFAGRISG